MTKQTDPRPNRARTVKGKRLESAARDLVRAAWAMSKDEQLKLPEGHTWDEAHEDAQHFIRSSYALTRALSVTITSAEFFTPPGMRMDENVMREGVSMMLQSAIGALDAAVEAGAVTPEQREGVRHELFMACAKGLGVDLTVEPKETETGSVH